MIKWNLTDHTAAMDGTSDWPGDPWDTSIPIIMVGTLDTIGMEGECSTVSIEFKPPSCEGRRRLGTHFKISR